MAVSVLEIVFMVHFNNNIFFIGPFASGKTTISEQLSKVTNIPIYPPDKWKWYFLFKNGYSLTNARRILHDYGFEELENYFRASLKVEEFVSVIEQFPNSIIEIPPYNAYYEDVTEIEIINNLINSSKYTFLILPSSNQKQALQELNKRLDIRFETTKQDFPELKENYKNKNKWILEHETNKNSNIKTIYTENKSVADTIYRMLSEFRDILPVL